MLHTYRKVRNYRYVDQWISQTKHTSIIGTQRKKHSSSSHIYMFVFIKIESCSNVMFCGFFPLNIMHIVACSCTVLILIAAWYFAVWMWINTFIHPFYHWWTFGSFQFEVIIIRMLSRFGHMILTVYRHIFLLGKFHSYEWNFGVRGMKMFSFNRFRPFSKVVVPIPMPMWLV